MTSLFLIVFLDLVGFGMIIPVLPFYAERLGVSPAQVPLYFGLYSLGNLIGAPLWGAASDRVGRRPILLATLAANVAANMLLAVAGTGLLLGLSRLVSGLAAGNISTAYAYVADISTDATRPRMMGMLSAAFGLGFVLGPALGGLLAGSGDSGGDIARVAHAAAFMSALAFVSTFFALKESHGPEHRAAVKADKRSGQWKEILARPALRDLLVATLVVIGAVAMLQSTFSVWGAEDLGLGPRKLGVLFGYLGAISVIIQGGAIGPLTRRFGAHGLTFTGIILLSISLATTPFSTSANMTLIPLALYAVGSALFVPSISSLVAHAAGPRERGAVLGVFQGMSSLGRVIGPFSATVIAGFFGLRAPFWVGAGICLVGAWIAREGERLAVLRGRVDIDGNTQPRIDG
ncbi:MAG: MFS transporter [Cytophagaceae bacterium]|nr:MFS transporter [Gemmatimonadaceae bacterium]